MFDFSAIMKVKSAWATFTGNHPKVKPFVNDVKSHNIQPGTEIAIAIRYPDGTESKTGIRVTPGDMELLGILKNLI